MSKQNTVLSLYQAYLGDNLDNVFANIGALHHSTVLFDQVERQYNEQIAIRSALLNVKANRDIAIRKRLDLLKAGTLTANEITILENDLKAFFLTQNLILNNNTAGTGTSEIRAAAIAKHFIRNIQNKTPNDPPDVTGHSNLTSYVQSLGYNNINAYNDAYSKLTKPLETLGQNLEEALIYTILNMPNIVNKIDPSGNHLQQRTQFMTHLFLQSLGINALNHFLAFPDQETCIRLGYADINAFMFDFKSFITQVIPEVLGKLKTSKNHVMLTTTEIAAFQQAITKAGVLKKETPEAYKNLLSPSTAPVHIGGTDSVTSINTTTSAEAKDRQLDYLNILTTNESIGSFFGKSPLESFADFFVNNEQLLFNPTFQYTTDPNTGTQSKETSLTDLLKTSDTDVQTAISLNAPSPIAVAEAVATTPIAEIDTRINELTHGKPDGSVKGINSLKSELDTHRDSQEKRLKALTPKSFHAQLIDPTRDQTRMDHPELVDAVTELHRQILSYGTANSKTKELFTLTHNLANALNNEKNAVNAAIKANQSIQALKDLVNKKLGNNADLNAAAEAAAGAINGLAKPTTITMTAVNAVITAAQQAVVAASAANTENHVEITNAIAILNTATTGDIAVCRTAITALPTATTARIAAQKALNAHLAIAENEAKLTKKAGKFGDANLDANNNGNDPAAFGIYGSPEVRAHLAAQQKRLYERTNLRKGVTAEEIQEVERKAKEAEDKATLSRGLVNAPKAQKSLRNARIAGNILTTVATMVGTGGGYLLGTAMITPTDDSTQARQGSLGLPENAAPNAVGFPITSSGASTSTSMDITQSVPIILSTTTTAGAFLGYFAGKGFEAFINMFIAAEPSKQQSMLKEKEEEAKRLRQIAKEMRTPEITSLVGTNPRVAIPFKQIETDADKSLLEITLKDRDPNKINQLCGIIFGSMIYLNEDGTLGGNDVALIRIKRLVFGGFQRNPDGSLPDSKSRLLDTNPKLTIQTHDAGEGIITQVLNADSTIPKRTDGKKLVCVVDGPALKICWAKVTGTGATATISEQEDLSIVPNAEGKTEFNVIRQKALDAMMMTPEYKELQKLYAIYVGTAKKDLEPSETAKDKAAAQFENGQSPKMMYRRHA